MVSKRRTYTREFKVETVNVITGSNQSVAEVARYLEIHPPRSTSGFVSTGRIPLRPFLAKESRPQKLRKSAVSGAKTNA